MADANVSQLEINGTTYDICDATARDSLSQYLPLTGGTISGNLLVESTISTNTLQVYNPNSTGHIETNKLTLWADTANANYAGLYFKSFNENNQVNRNEPFIRCYGTGDSKLPGGDALLIGNGGLTVVGGGEAATTTYDYYTTQTTSPLYPNSEVLILASDNNMYFVTNANTTETMEKLRLTGVGTLVHDDSTIDLTKSNNGVTDTKSHSWSILDKNGYYLGWLEGRAYTNGSTALTCKTRNYGTGSAITHGFTLGVENDGTRTTTFDSPATWLTGLKLNPTKYTGSLTNGCSGKMRCWHVGYQGKLEVDMNTGTITCAAKTWTTVGTVPIHPAENASGVGFAYNSSTGMSIIETRIDTSGNVRVWPYTQITTSSSLTFTLEFISTTLHS